MFIKLAKCLPLLVKTVEKNGVSGSKYQSIRKN